MPEQSIFHNIVRRETAYTQLLCNMLKRDPKFREALLVRCGVVDPMAVAPSHIWAEKRLDGGSGQADILIDAPNLCMIIEIKTEVHRGKQSTQEDDEAESEESEEIKEIRENKRTYLGFLRRRKKRSPNALARLVFLIPSAWVHRPGIEKQIKRHSSDTVGVEMLLWPHLLEVLELSKDKNLAEEVQLLINESFGPIGFKSEERHLIFSKEFQLETLVKIVALLDGVRQGLKTPLSKKMTISKGELGFYFGDESRWLYVGFWQDFWKEQDHLSPICFGVEVEKVAADVTKAFIKSLRDVYGQDSVQFSGYEMGYIPQEDFDDHDALETIRSKIRKICEAMQIASN